MISLKIQFSGGLESLFSFQPTHPLILNLTLPPFVPLDNSTNALTPGFQPPAETKPVDVTYLIHHLRDHHLKERVELFMDNGTV